MWQRSLGMVMMAVLLGGGTLPAAAQGWSQPRCVVSSDPAFGFTAASPIPVGGGTGLGPDRERRYLEVLSGPAGEAVAAQRRGSVPRPDDPLQHLSVYEVAVEGADRPILLYLDVHRFESPEAPPGFTCARSLALALGPPVPFDPAASAAAVASLAIELGRDRDFGHVPLEAGGVRYGAAFDFFRLVALRARIEAGAADAARLQALPFESFFQRMQSAYEAGGGAASLRVMPASREVTFAIAAFPRTCNGMLIPPIAIELAAQSAARPGPLVTSDALPGVELPDASLVRFFLDLPQPPNSVRITYPLAPGCADGVPSDVLLPLVLDGARGLRRDAPPLPPGVDEPDPVVFVRVVYGPDGTIERPIILSGPEALRTPAEDAVRRWAFQEPMRLNGVPLVTVSTLSVIFR